MSKKCPRKYLGTEKASLKKYRKGFDAFLLPWWCRWILATSLVHLIPKNVYNGNVQVWWEWNWGLFWAISSNNSISDIVSGWLEKYVIYLKTRGCVKCLQTKMWFVRWKILEIPSRGWIVTKMRVITFGEGERGTWKDQLCHEGAEKRWGRRLGYGKGL